MYEAFKTPVKQQMPLSTAYGAYNRGNITPKVLDLLWQYHFQILTQLDPYLTLKRYGFQFGLL